MSLKIKSCTEHVLDTSYSKKIDFLTIKLRVCLYFLFSTVIATDAEGPVTIRYIESITSSEKEKFPVWSSYQLVRAGLLND